MNLWELLVTRPAAATLTLDSAAVDIERSGDGKVDLLETLKPILQRPAQAYASDPYRRRQAPVSTGGAQPT